MEFQEKMLGLKIKQFRLDDCDDHDDQGRAHLTATWVDEIGNGRGQCFFTQPESVRAQFIRLGYREIR